MELKSGNRRWPVMILLFLISSTIFSYFNYYNRKLDGDIVNIVLPIDSYKPVLSDPLGFQAIFQHKQYGGTNRWFCHQSMRFLFLDVYKAVNIFSRDKVTGLYITQAIGFLITHLLLLMAMSLYVLSRRNFTLLNLLVVLAIITPFFHIHENLNLMDYNITYVLFYTLPLSLILIFLYPFYNYFISGESALFNSALKTACWSVLGFCVSFSSASNPVIGSFFGIIILLALLLKRKTTANDKNIRNMLVLITAFLLLCCYSFYLGTFNNENNHEFSLAERYVIFFSFFIKYFSSPQFLLLYLFIAICICYIRNVKLSDGDATQFKVLKIILAVGLLYVLLLPFGGYRPYRPMILRSDITLPFSVAFILFTCFLSFVLIKNLREKQKTVFCFILTVLLSIFYFSDFKFMKDHTLEKKYLTIIQHHTSNDKLILPSNTSILSWKNIETEDQYHTIAMMLYKWQITDTVRPYTQK